MKKIFSILILSVVFFASCKKDNKQTGKSDGKLHTVNFTVNKFLQQHLQFQGNSISRPKTLNDVISYTPLDTVVSPVLYYRVYDASGNLVHNIYQDSTTVNFGTINDQLLAGTYTVVMVGGENTPYTPEGSKKLLINSQFGTGTLMNDNIYYEYFSGFSDVGISQFFNETFYKKFTLTVNDNNVSQNITLTHLVGQLIVNIQDATPSNISYISLTIGSIAYDYSFGYGLPNVIGDSGSVSYTQLAAGTTNYRMYNYILNTASPFTVTISAYNSVSGLIASKTIQNVSCTANKQTILTGNLFGGTGNSIGGNVNITADTTWNPTPINYHF